MTDCKTWYTSKTVRYNAAKFGLGLLTFITALIAFQLGAQHQGISPFTVPEQWLIYASAVLLMLDGSVGVWLRSVTSQPLSGGK